jgi:hypothetical protein
MGRKEVPMSDVDDAREGSPPSVSGDRAAERDRELEQKAQELEVFRDAGILTDAEFDEQMAKFRWRLR